MRPRKKPLKPFLLLRFLGVLGGLEAASAAETLKEESTDAAKTEIREQTEPRNSQALLQLGWVSIIKAGKHLTGLAPSVGFSHATSSWLSLGGNVRFAFQPSSVVAIYTALELKAVLAITGTFIQNDRSIFLDEKEVFRGRDLNPGGLRLELNGTQFFFNSSSSIVPFTGFGGAAYYIFASQSSVNFLLGGKYEFLYSASMNLKPIQGFAGITLGF
ncbi:hypothetical protein WDW37_18800 [Bdellovibrionota bacterium FG-1]